MSYYPVLDLPTSKQNSAEFCCVLTFLLAIEQCISNELVLKKLMSGQKRQVVMNQSDIYIYTYIYIYIHICICIYIYMYTCICTTELSSGLITEFSQYNRQKSKQNQWCHGKKLNISKKPKEVRPSAAYRVLHADELRPPFCRGW